MENNDKNKKSAGYIMGQVLGVVLVGCATAVVMACAIRLTAWILLM